MSKSNNGQSKRSKRPPRKESPSTEARQALARALAKHAASLAQEDLTQKESIVKTSLVSGSLSDRIGQPIKKRKKTALELAHEAAEREASTTVQANKSDVRVWSTEKEEEQKAISLSKLQTMTQAQQYELLCQGFIDPLPTLQGLQCVEITLMDNVFSANSDWLEYRRMHMNLGELHLASMCSIVLDHLAQEGALLAKVLLRWRADHFLLIHDFSSRKQLALMPNGKSYC